VARPKDPKQTRPRLWQAATDARAALGDAWVLDGEHYRLDRTKARIDLDQQLGLQPTRETRIMYRQLLGQS
jgi:hypothetical protein